MNPLYTGSRGIKLQRVNMGILTFALCLWLYSILPLFVAHPVACFMALAALSVLFLFFYCCYRKNGIYVRRSRLIWGGILFPLMISNAESFDLYTGANILIYLLGVFFIVFCCHAIDEFDSSIKLLKILTALYIASIYLQYLNKNLFERLFLKYFDSLSFFYYQSPYMIGMGGSPGVATVNCTIAIAILMSFNREHKLKTYIFKLSYMLVIVMAYFFIAKKSGLLSAVFGVMIVYWIKNDRKVWKKLITLSLYTLILCGIACCITQLNGNLYISVRMKEAFGQLIGGRDFSSGRISLYKDAWNEFLKNPVFGMGWGVFSSVHGNLVHNIYLQLLCETGIIGFLLFIIPIACTYVKTCKMVIYYRNQGFHTKIENYLIFSLYIQSEFLFISLFENNLYMAMPLYLYFFACGISTAAGESIHARTPSP